MGWLNGWQKRKKITIPAAQVDAAAVDFPVYVAVTDADLATAQADGDDITVTASDGVTQLKSELELFSQGPGTLYLHFKAPALSAVVANEFYVYWENATCGSQHDGENVWDSDYIMVQHLDADTFLDSTANSHDLTNYGASQNGAARVGQRCYDFERGDPDMMEAADHADFTPAAGLTVEAWVKPESFSTLQGVVGHYIAANAAGGAVNERSWATNLYQSGGTEVLRLSLSGNGTALVVATGGTDLATGTWYHTAGVWTPSTKAEVFLNGATDGNNTTSIPAALFNCTYPLYVGQFAYERGHASQSSFAFDGLIDEVRISKVARADTWIQTGYNNQNDPAAFVTWGALEVPPGSECPGEEVIYKDAYLSAVLDATSNIRLATCASGAIPVADNQLVGMFAEITGLDAVTGKLEFVDAIEDVPPLLTVVLWELADE